MVAPSQPMIGKASKDKDVMGALRQKKTGKKAENVKLTMPQIIEADMKRQDPNIDINKVMNGLSHLVKTKGAKFIQIGNTVFMITPLKGGEVELHTMTVEPMDTVIQRWKSIPNTLKEMGFKHLVSYGLTPGINRVVQRTGLPVKISQSQMMQGNKMVPAYRYDLDL